MENDKLVNPDICCRPEIVSEPSGSSVSPGENCPSISLDQRREAAVAAAVNNIRIVETLDMEALLR
jgi:hypothetical protein